VAGSRLSQGRKDDYLERTRELQAFVEHPAAALVL
jgi:hypothetical protein